MGSNRSFFLGAGAMLVGILAGNAIRVATIDNLRKFMLLADEARDLYTGTKIRIPNQQSQSEDDILPLAVPNYDPMFDREAPPAPPPADYSNFKPSSPVHISFEDDEDFLTKINEDVTKGVSLIEDWTFA